MDKTYINKLIKKPSTNKPTVRLINIVLSDSINNVSGMNTLSNFTVSESGYYNICYQIVLESTINTQIDTLQYGLCMDNMTDFGECFNSIGSQSFSVDSFLSQNIGTTKFLEAGITYKSWFNLLLIDGSMNYIKDYSKCTLIKL